MESYRAIEKVRTENLYRRSVNRISTYLEPRDMYNLIHSKTWEYSPDSPVDEYVLRDQAMMCMSYCSAGRITEVVGGPSFQLGPRLCRICWKENKASIELRKETEGEEVRWVCPTHSIQKRYKRIAYKTGTHPGLYDTNLTFSPQHIKVTGMRVVKRSPHLITKYGEQIRLRDEFIIPLEKGLFTNPFWDQLVPFGRLIKKYVETYQPKGKLFGYGNYSAYQIIRFVTSYHPHWFRAMAEHFYGHFLLSDTIKLSKFVKIQDPNQVKSYVGYSWQEQLKDVTMSMDFKWIDQYLNS